jgi:hypothetical protein
MKRTKERLMIQAFERYGTIQKIEIEGDSGYFFISDLKKITEDKVLISAKSLPFIVILDGFIVNIFSFFVDEDLRKVEEKESLEILNCVNSNTRYGRFYRDNEGDITWEFSFEIKEQEIEDIAPYLLSCAVGLKEIIFKMSSVYEKQ